MLPEPIAATVQVTAVLEKLGITYCIGGSLASTIYGLVRTTQDSDLVADMHSEHVTPFVRALEGDFYVDEESIAEAVVATAEDTLLAKLEWYRMGGEVSERQWRDVLGILKVQAGRLDLAYLRRWAIELKVEDLLERAVNDADG